MHDNQNASHLFYLLYLFVAGFFVFAIVLLCFSHQFAASIFCSHKKSILFTKDMVQKKFNVPSGSSPVELLRRNEPHALREPYRVGLMAPMKHDIQVLKATDDRDVVSINMTWVLLCIALVLSPGMATWSP